ncbi:hypothetical protein KDX27_37660 [Burkholderia cenocepacia]|uniref:hypothetical protein n=1 Tax=Burkholderia cenocepacia TaxID=95486 RepID=UPI001B947943|nr:hypothetical protein [Burkholderia cenocepacia]MBR8029881.1 hypothetical protein [Burkholderia cenocepacia]MBR8173418.1 hypothetical protein [Burkholderia cenocepacia]
MQGTYLRWYESAVSRFVSPLANIQRQAAVAALVAGEPIVIDETVLKVERCDWPAPDGLGFQIFGRNAQRVELCVVLDLDHPQPLQIEKVVAAIAWAEQQATNRSTHPDDPGLELNDYDDPPVLG